jgi:hypothetical protein
MGWLIALIGLNFWLRIVGMLSNSEIDHGGTPKLAKAKIDKIT